MLKEQPCKRASRAVATIVDAGSLTGELLRPETDCCGGVGLDLNVCGNVRNDDENGREDGRGCEQDDQSEQVRDMRDIWLRRQQLR